MGHSTRAGASLHALVKMAIPVCQLAEREHPRRGPGRPPEIPEWVMVVLITVAILKHRKTKSAQYRFLSQNRTRLLEWIGTRRFPSRSTYFERYRRAHRLLRAIVRLQGVRLLKQKIGDERCVAVDKSLVRSLGPEWPKRLRERGKLLPGVDRESTWGYSKHHGWVQGYSYEVLISAGKKGLVVPLSASVDQAHWSEHRSLPEKISHVPPSTKYVLADAAYDANDHADAIERDSSGKPTGRHFLCPQVYRRGEHRRPRQPCHEPHLLRRAARSRREARLRYFQTKMARLLYSRRSATAEPFNEWFKSSFNLRDRAWHRGLDNNRTQILAAFFAYQLLVRYNRRCRRRNGRVRWILDAL
jgi:hypothetical protein